MPKPKNTDGDSSTEWDPEEIYEEQEKAEQATKKRKSDQSESAAQKSNFVVRAVKSFVNFVWVLFARTTKSTKFTNPKTRKGHMKKGFVNPFTKAVGTLFTIVGIRKPKTAKEIGNELERALASNTIEKDAVKAAEEATKAVQKAVEQTAKVVQEQAKEITPAAAKEVETAIAKPPETVTPPATQTKESVVPAQIKSKTDDLFEQFKSHLGDGFIKIEGTPFEKMEEDQKTKYLRMKKMGLEEGAIWNLCQKDLNLGSKQTLNIKKGTTTSAAKEDVKPKMTLQEELKKRLAEKGIAPGNSDEPSTLGGDSVNKKEPAAPVQVKSTVGPQVPQEKPAVPAQAKSTVGPQVHSEKPAAPVQVKTKTDDLFAKFESHLGNGFTKIKGTPFEKMEQAQKDKYLRMHKARLPAGAIWQACQKDLDLAPKQTLNIKSGTTTPAADRAKTPAKPSGDLIAEMMARQAKMKAEKERKESEHSGKPLTPGRAGANKSLSDGAAKRSGRELVKPPSAKKGPTGL